MKTVGFILCSLVTFCGASAYSTPETGAEESAPKVRYKKGKDINFEELLIQGQLKRPEISVVTANEKQSTNGLLRLREDFLDRFAEDTGETLP